MNEKRVAWAVTGAGHLLGECAGIIGRCRGVDLFLSRAGEEVVRMYGLYAGMRATGIPIHTEKKSSAPVVSRFFKGVYGVLVIAPATSNSVAKFVHGISDTLVTNLFAQAGKAKVPVIILPTDQAPEMTSTAPGDASITVYPRNIDLENTRKLSSFNGAHIVADCRELEKHLAAYADILK